MPGAMPRAKVLCPFHLRPRVEEDLAQLKPLKRKRFRRKSGRKMNRAPFKSLVPEAVNASF